MTWGLLSVHPASEGRKEELQMDGVGHDALILRG